MKRNIPLPSSCFSNRYLTIAEEIVHRSKTYPVIQKPISEITCKDIHFPVMKGVDNLGRLFIVIKLIVDNQSMLQVFLQLHGKCYPIWIAIGISNPLIYNKSILSFEQLKLIVGLFRQRVGDQSIYIQDITVVDSFYRNKPLSIPYTSKCIDGVNTIHEQLNLCSYNPLYKMCATVQMRNMKDVYEKHGKLVCF